MFDLVRFHSDSDSSASALRSIDVRSLPPSLFSSVPDVERARIMAKRVKFIHMTIWPTDVGLARLFKEQGAVMVVGVSDFLPLPPAEMAKRLARTAHMIKMVRHFGGKVRLASMARNEGELRNPLELACIGERLGLDARAVMEGLNAPLEA
jgi:RNase P/RNase MRP subunit p30